MLISKFTIVINIMKFTDWKILILIILASIVIYPLLGPVVFAIVLSYMSWPLCKRIKRVFKDHTTGAAVTTSLVVALILVPVILAVLAILKNVEGVVAIVTNSVPKLLEIIGSWGIKLSGENIVGIVQQSSTYLSQVVFTTPKVIIGFLIMIVMLFYFLKEKENIEKYVSSVAKSIGHTKLMNRMHQMIKGIVFGYIGKAVIIGIIAWIGFQLMGFSFAVLLGLIIGFAALIPALGPILIILPIVAFNYLQGNVGLAVTVFVFAILLNLLDVLLITKMSARMTRVHPAIMFLGVIGGPLMFGVKGIILGPLILGILKVVLDEYKS
jgi:predicted PurR-regulated permease PerM